MTRPRPVARRGTTPLYPCVHCGRLVPWRSTACKQCLAEPKPEESLRDFRKRLEGKR